MGGGTTTEQSSFSMCNRHLFQGGKALCTWAELPYFFFVPGFKANVLFGFKLNPASLQENLLVWLLLWDMDSAEKVLWWPVVLHLQELNQPPSAQGPGLRKGRWAEEALDINEEMLGCEAHLAPSSLLRGKRGAPVDAAGVERGPFPLPPPAP